MAKGAISIFRASKILMGDCHIIGTDDIKLDKKGTSQPIPKINLEADRLMQVIDLLPDPTMVIDTNGRVIIWNRAMEVLTGVKSGDVIGKGNYEYAVPFYGERRPTLIDSVLNPIQDMERICPNINKSCDGYLTAEVYLPEFNGGTYFFMTASPLCDSDGNIIGAIESIRNISDLKRAEKALRESEMAYRAIFENTGTATIIIEEDTTVSLINGGMEKLSGYTKSEVEGKMSWTEMVPKDELERMLAQHRLRRENPASALDSYEFKLRDKGGRIKDVIISIAMIPGSKKSVASFQDITERKRAEVELRSSQDKYRAMFENTGTAMMIIEPNTIVSLVNVEFEKLARYSKEEIEGKMSWTEFVVKEDLERMLKYHQQRRETGRPAPREYEYRLIDKSGEIKDMFLTISMIPGTNKSVASLMNITERKKIERAIRESQRRMADIIQFLPDATMVIDSQGKIIAWNKAMVEMTGFKAEDMLGKGDYEYAVPFYGQRMPILIDLVLRPSEDLEKRYPYVNRSSDGRLTAEAYLPEFSGGTHFFMTASPLCDSEGKIIGAIESLRDISGLKRAEKALRESEMAYRAIFENTGTATIIIEDDTTVSLINGEMEKLSGYSKPEVEGKMSWTTLVVKEDLERMLVQHRLRREDPASALNSYEFKLRDKGGMIRDIILSISMIPGTKRSVASFLDITERKRVEEELRRSQDKYRSMFENTGTAMMIIDPDTIISLVNMEFEKLTGYAKKEIEGKMSWTTFVVKEDLERMLKYHQQRRAAGVSPPREYEYRLIDKSGSIKDMFLTISMIPGTNKSVASLMNITERKKTERAVQESQRRMADIINFLPDATLVIDCRGKIIAWNQAMAHLTGIKAEDMLGKGDYIYSVPFYGERRKMLIDLVLHPNDDLEKSYPGLQRDGSSLVTEVFIPNFKPGGAYLWTKASPLYDSQGNIVGAIETLRDVTERKRTEQSLERSRAELRIAAEIQKSFIPKKTPVVSDFELAAVTIPAMEVGGDFYDFISLPDGLLGLVIADVAGKSIPAALFMALSRTIVRSNAARRPGISDVLRDANDMIAADATAGMFVTLLYGVLDGKSHSLTYSNAGHPSPLIFKSGQRICISQECDGVALGAFEGMEYVEHKIQFNTGDIAIFYTDGVTEAVNRNGELYGLNRLSEVIIKCCNLTAQEIMGIILEDISSFSGNQDQYDDITLIVVKAEDTSRKFHEITVPAKDTEYPDAGDQKESMTNNCNLALPAREEEIPRAMEFIETIMAKAGFHSGKVLEVQLAVEEALMNVIHHSYAGVEGKICLTSETCEDGLVVTLEDEGTRFDPTQTNGPKLSDDIEERPIGGLGIHLIRSFVEVVKYEFKDGKNTLILVVKRD